MIHVKFQKLIREMSVCSGKHWRWSFRRCKNRGRCLPSYSSLEESQVLVIIGRYPLDERLSENFDWWMQAQRTSCLW